MRIEDIYFDEALKVRKTKKCTRQHSDNTVRVRDFRVISTILNLMRTYISFFRRE